MESAFIRVLLVDDEPGILDISKQYLELDQMFSIDTAASAVDALDCLELQTYDVVVSDYQMPGKDGIELLKTIRGSGSDVPFILFTGKGREDVVIQALNNGASFYLQKGGDPTSLFAELSNMVRQASSRKEGERALMMSEESYRSLFESSIDAVLLTTIDGRIISANSSACRMLGLAQEQVQSMGSEGWAVNNEAWAQLHRELAKKGSAKGELTFKREGGAEFTGEVSSSYFTDLKGDRQISMIVRDITEKNAGEEALRASELRYRRLFETAQDGILILDGGTEKVIDANQFIMDLTGYPVNSFLGKHLWELGFIEDRSLAEGAFSKLRTEGYVRYENIPLRRKDGKIMQVEFISNSYAVGELSIIQCNIRDISDRLLLHEKTMELAGIVDSSEDAIIGIDLQGIATSWNAGAEEVYGYARGEMIGGSVSLLSAPNSKDDLMKILAKVTCGESIVHYETTRLTKEGAEINVAITVSPVLDAQGRIIGASTISSNITERVRTQVALKEANRKLNLLSSITRHDINNQLLVLAGNLSFLEQETDPRAEGHIRKIKVATDRISAMIQFTKEYEQIGVNVPVWQDLRRLTGKAAQEATLGAVTVKNDIPDGMEIYADPLIAKVFHNLIGNAVQHGKTITTIHFYLQEVAGTFDLVCADDGVGISSEVRDGLFTHNPGKTHGFGLFLSREILSITAISINEIGSPGEGATFIMTAPEGGIRRTPQQAQ
jgi:PAS domain S-box-containing protein